MLDLPDLARIFVPDTPLIEIVIRGTVTYLALFALLRVALKRESGTVGITNLLVVVLIADAAQNAMGDDYHSVVDGLVLVVTILTWSYLLDWLGYRVPLFGALVHPPPLALIRDGRPIRRNMRQELVTFEELMTQLRLQGINELDEVESAFMEGNGEISVVRRDGETQGADRRSAAG